MMRTLVAIALLIASTMAGAAQVSFNGPSSYAQYVPKGWCPATPFGSAGPYGSFQCRGGVSYFRCACARIIPPHGACNWVYLGRCPGR